MDITKERIQKILAAGANVVLTTQGVDDLCMKYFVDAGAMAVRRCKKGDLQVWPLYNCNVPACFYPGMLDEFSTF